MIKKCSRCRKDLEKVRTHKTKNAICLKCQLKKRKEWRRKNRQQPKPKKITRGFTCGAMDLLHAGHVLMLKECRERCDYLIVGLQTDPSIDRPEKNKPVETMEERLIRLQACKYVDEIIPYSTEKELYLLLTVIRPDIRFVGVDHLGNKFTGDDLPIKIFYNSRNHNYSSSSLRERIIKQK